MRHRRLYWHHPAVYIVLFVNVLIYIVVALAIRRQAGVAPGLCRAHKRRRIIGIASGWGGFLIGLAIASRDEESRVWMLGGMALSLASLLLGMMFARIVAPKHIDAEYLRLRGCGRAFLNSLPEFTG